MCLLRESLEQSVAGSGRVVLLTGEPGIGKTRTAYELAALARRASAAVLAGRSHEGDGAPAYWCGDALRDTPMVCRYTHHAARSANFVGASRRGLVGGGTTWRHVPVGGGTSASRARTSRA
jgi:AAA ATPase domain